MDVGKSLLINRKKFMDFDFYIDDLFELVAKFSIMPLICII